MENFRALRTASGEADDAEGVSPDEVYTIAGSPPMQACSACAGNYEDPDRTAGSDDELLDEDAERELDEPDPDGVAPREKEVRTTRRQIDAVPEGFMNGE